MKVSCLSWVDIGCVIMDLINLSGSRQLPSDERHGEVQTEEEAIFMK